MRASSCQDAAGRQPIPVVGNAGRQPLQLKGEVTGARGRQPRPCVTSAQESRQPGRRGDMLLAARSVTTLVSQLQ